jgi:hypothetical protein
MGSFRACSCALEYQVFVIFTKGEVQRTSLARLAELAWRRSRLSLDNSVTYITNPALAGAFREAYIGALAARVKGKAPVIPITGLTP